MNCPRCGAFAPERHRFCSECGLALPRRCADCGTINGAELVSCGTCGSALNQPPRPEKRSEAERRQVTVMFCDMVNSTALGSRLDPEDLREVVNAHHAEIRNVMSQFGGYIARYMGDGVLVYFGYPQAREDDAERAVRAGLAVAQAVQDLSTPAGPPGTLATRVGIATGLVVVGDEIGSGTSLEHAIIGDTPNLAARLQGLAEPGKVVIGAGTRNLIGRLFDCAEHPPRQLKGYAIPVPYWTVLRESDVHSRFEALRTGRRLPLLGRGPELELLQQCWDQARAGHGQVVVLTGEAGIGKSRLTAAFEEQIRKQSHLRLRYLCSPHYQNSALHPVMVQLARAARFQRGDSEATRLRKLRSTLPPTSGNQEDYALIADLMGLPVGESFGIQRLTPARRKERTFEAILNQLDVLVATRPVVMILEDMHWADASTLEMLERVVERAPGLRLLAIVTTRPGQLPAWVERPSIHRHRVARLDRDQAADLVSKVTGARQLPRSVVDQILAHADGVPLFVEELTRTMLETGVDASQRTTLGTPVVVPSSLHASLTARLDRLADGKEVAQMGAVIGRDFSLETFLSTFSIPEGQLREGLRALVEAELLVEIGREPDVVYSFRHALVQDAAYGSMLRPRRRSLHLQVAEALEREAAEEAEPEILAQHFAAAGIADRAIDYYLKAAARAATRSAVAELVSHLRRGLELLATLPDTAETRRRELQLQVALGRGLIDSVGSSSEEGYAAFKRARELSLELGDTEHLLAILYGLQVYHFTHAEPETVIRYANEILELGNRTGDNRALVLGERVAGSAYLLLGRFAEARQAYENLIRLYDPTEHGGAADHTPRDPLVAGCAFLGVCLTVMALPGYAREVEHRGLEHAERLNHPISIVFSLRRNCVQHMLGRDFARVERVADRLLEITVDYETFLGGPEGALFQSWARLHHGFDPDEHARMLLALDQLDQARTWALLPYMMAAAAELSWNAGQSAVALRLLDRAEELVRLTGERWCEAEVLRLRARFSPDVEEPWRLLREALDLSRGQDARLWELRIARDLAERLVVAGDVGEAETVLTTACNACPEGHCLPDYKDAAALLESVASMTHTAPSGSME